MAKYSVKVIRNQVEKLGVKEFERLKDRLKHHYPVFAAELEAEFKKMIAKGQSPIRGNGRFPAYKAAQNKKGRGPIKKGYPASVKKDFPAKRERPVNLFLSGDFLKNLRGKAKGSGILSLGFSDPLQKKKEQGHREGVNGQPMRPVIPDDALGEKMAISIEQKLLKSFQNVLAKLLKTLK